MKAKLLCLLLIISLTFSTVVFAAPQGSAEELPFKFSVASADGSDIILDASNDYKAQLKVIIEPASALDGYGEKITLNKVENTSDKGEEISLNNIERAKGDKDPYIYRSTFSFSSADVGHSVVFKLYWTDSNNVPRETEAELLLAKPAPKVSIKAEPDMFSVAPGGIITIKYEVINVGNVALKYVTLLDNEVAKVLDEENPLPIIKKDRSNEFLAVGDSYEATVSIELDAVITSKPKAIYSYAGTTYEQEGEETVLSAADIMPTVSLTCENYSVAVKGTMQTFIYEIKNDFNVTLTNIRVYDSESDDANLIYGPFSLEPEQQYTGSYELPVTKSGFYKFKIVYSYEGADGDKEMLVKTDKAIKLPNEVYLRITKIFPETIMEPGELTFTLTIENATNSELRNLVISEEGKLMEKLELKNTIVPAASDNTSEKLTREVTVNIPKTDTRVKFSLSYTINGELATTNTIYDVRFSQILATPTPTAEATPQPPANQKDNSQLIMWILLGILCLLLLAGIIVLLVYIKRTNAPDEETERVRRRVTNAFDDDYENNYSEPKYDDSYDETFDEEYADEFDDEGVKIYKGKK